jgi:cyclopropane fatty-acyl-phospholipid synthase-like methyltransferase
LGFWHELQSYQLNTLKENGLRAEHSLLDIGCGPLQGGLAFIKYLEESKYFGIDIELKNIETGIKTY